MIEVHDFEWVPQGLRRIWEEYGNYLKFEKEDHWELVSMSNLTLSSYLLSLLPCDSPMRLRIKIEEILGLLSRVSPEIKVGAIREIYDFLEKRINENIRQNHQIQDLLAHLQINF